MIFKVIGSDPATGQKFAATIKADDAAAAQRAVERRGITVLSIAPVAQVQHAAPAPAQQNANPPSVRAQAARAASTARPGPTRPLTALQAMPAAVPTLVETTEDEPHAAPQPPPPRYTPRVPAPPPQPDYYSAPEYAADSPDALADPADEQPETHYVSRPPPLSRRLGKPSFFSSNRNKILITSAALLFLAVGAWATWAFLLAGSGSMAQFRAYIPENAVTFGVINVSKLRQSDFYKDNQTIVKSATDQMKDVFGTMDDVETIFVASASTQEKDVYFVVRMKSEDALNKAIAGKATHVTLEGADVSQVQAPGQTHFATRIAPSTLAVTQDRQTMQDLIRRSRSPTVKLEDSMERAMKEVSGEDNYMVFTSKALPGGTLPMPGTPFKTCGFGISVGASVTMRMVLVTNTAADTAVISEHFKPGNMPQPPGMPPQFKGLYDKIETTSSGDMVKIQGKWTYADLKSIVSQFSGMMESMQPQPAQQPAISVPSGSVPGPRKRLPGRS